MQKDKGSEEVSGSESHPTTQQTSLVHTPQGRPLIHKPDCRICKQLEKKGVGDDLFQGHLGKFFRDCPKFVAMTQEDRVLTCLDAKICISCLSPTVKLNAAHDEECKKKKEVQAGLKNEFTCQVKDCYFSIWACVTHKQDPLNISSIQNKKDVMAKRGWTMGL